MPARCGRRRGSRWPGGGGHAGSTRCPRPARAWRVRTGSRRAWTPSLVELARHLHPRACWKRSSAAWLSGPQTPSTRPGKRPPSAAAPAPPSSPAAIELAVGSPGPSAPRPTAQGRARKQQPLQHRSAQSHCTCSSSPHLSASTPRGREVAGLRSVASAVTGSTVSSNQRAMAVVRTSPPRCAITCIPPPAILRTRPERTVTAARRAWSSGVDTKSPVAGPPLLPRTSAIQTAPGRGAKLITARPAAPSRGVAELRRFASRKESLVAATVIASVEASTAFARSLTGASGFRHQRTLHPAVLPAVMPPPTALAPSIAASKASIKDDRRAQHRHPRPAQRFHYRFEGAARSLVERPPTPLLP